MLPLPASGASK